MMSKITKDGSCTSCESQCLDCRDPRITKKWQPDGMMLIPVNLAKRFSDDEADASDRAMLKGFIRDV